MSTSGAERSRRPIEATPQKLLGNKIRDMVIPVKKMNEIREIGKMWARQVSGYIHCTHIGIWKICLQESAAIAHS